MNKNGLIKVVSEKQKQIRRGFWSKEELKKLIDLAVQNDPDKINSEEKHDN